MAKDLSILEIVSQWRNEYELHLFQYWMPGTPENLFIGILVSLDNGYIGQKPGLFFQSLDVTPKGELFPSLHKDIESISPDFLMQFLCGLGFECYIIKSVNTKEWQDPLKIIIHWEAYSSEVIEHEALPIDRLIMDCGGCIPAWLQVNLQLIKDQLPAKVADSLASFVIVDSCTITN